MARGPDQPRRRPGGVARGRGRGGNGGGGREQSPGGKQRAAGLNKHAEKKGKIVSIKNRIRSIERLLKKVRKRRRVRYGGTEIHIDLSSSRRIWWTLRAPYRRHVW